MFEHFLEIWFACVLDREDEHGDREAAGVVVAGDKRGDLTAYHANTNLRTRNYLKLIIRITGTQKRDKIAKEQKLCDKICF